MCLFTGHFIILSNIHRIALSYKDIEKNSKEEGKDPKMLYKIGHLNTCLRIYIEAMKLKTPTAKANVTNFCCCCCFNSEEVVSVQNQVYFRESGEIRL